MARAKELLKNTGILMIARVSTQVVSFLLLPLYTAILTTVEYGEVDFYLSLSMILIPFATLQLEQGIFRFVLSSKSEEETSEIVSTGVGLVLLSLASVSVLFLVANLFLRIPRAGLLYLYYLSFTLSALMYQICRGFGRNGVYALGSFISASLCIVLNVYFIAGLRIGVSGILLSTVIANIVAAVYMALVVRVYRYVRADAWRKDKAGALIKYSVPLIFNQVSSWAVNYSNRIVIIAFFGLDMNGIFSLASKFPNLLSTFLNVYNLAWTENTVRSLEDADCRRYVNRVITLTFQVYFCVVSGILNLLPLVFHIFVNSQYNNAYPHIPFLLTGMLFSGMAAMLGSIYLAHRKTKDVGVTTMLAGVLNIVIHLALLRALGLYAASVATCVSFASLFVFRYFNMRKFARVNIRFQDVLPAAMIFLVSLAAYYLKRPLFVHAGLSVNLAYIGWMVVRNFSQLKAMLSR